MAPAQILSNRAGSAHSRALDEAVTQMTFVGSRVYRQVKSMMMRDIGLPENMRELGGAQAMVLQVLNGRGQHMTSELARMHNVTTPTMTRIVDGLVEKGLVERRQDPEDRRCIFLELTAEGKEIGADIDRRFRESMRKFLSPLSQEQLEDIKRAHQHLASLIGEGNSETETTRANKSQFAGADVSGDIKRSGTSLN